MGGMIDVVQLTDKVILKQVVMYQKSKHDVHVSTAKSKLLILRQLKYIVQGGSEGWRSLLVRLRHSSRQ